MACNRRQSALGSTLWREVDHGNWVLFPENSRADLQIRYQIPLKLLHFSLVLTAYGPTRFLLY
eukprot:3764917-Rhodomonas_salina.3